MKWYEHFTGPLHLFFSEVLIDPIKDILRERRRRKYISNLEYVLHRLNHPHHDDLDSRDRRYKIEAVRWLQEYYRGNYDFLTDGPPDVKLEKILSKPTRDVTLRDHVYTKVLYYWKEHKRVEGF